MTHRTVKVLLAVALVLILSVLGASAAQVGDGGGTTGKAASKPAPKKAKKTDTAKRSDKSETKKAEKEK